MDKKAMDFGISWCARKVTSATVEACFAKKCIHNVSYGICNRQWVQIADDGACKSYDVVKEAE